MLAIFISVLLIGNINLANAKLLPLLKTEAFPDVSFINFNEKQFSLIQKLKKTSQKGVIINFWATWCPPCIKELPSLNKMAGIVKDFDIKVFAISMDRGETKKLKIFLQEKGGSNLIFAHDKKWNAGKILSIKNLPMTLVLKIDNQGNYNIVSRYLGALEWHKKHNIEQIKLMIN